MDAYEKVSSISLSCLLSQLLLISVRLLALLSSSADTGESGLDQLTSYEADSSPISQRTTSFRSENSPSNPNVW